MTVGKVCHTLWEDVVVHVCGKPAGHEWAHLCACGAMLHVGSSTLTDEQRKMRARDCPTCQARAGRPCHTKIGAVMSGVHAERQA